LAWWDFYFEAFNMNDVQSKTLKPATTFEEQIAILKERGLIIENTDYAFSVLNRSY
jgi:hypothetical protein